jgi:universal stress protein A
MNANPNMPGGPYQRVLIAVDLSAESETVVRSGLRQCAAEHQPTLLHVCEYLPIDPTTDGLVAGAMLAPDELLAAAERRLQALATALALSPATCEVRMGSPRAEIVAAASEHRVELIVLGQHERHGLRALFDATEDGVLHRAPCDVLAVHVPA